MGKLYIVPWSSPLTLGEASEIEVFEEAGKEAVVDSNDVEDGPDDKLEDKSIDVTASEDTDIVEEVADDTPAEVDAADGTVKVDNEEDVVTGKVDDKVVPISEVIIPDEVGAADEVGVADEVGFPDEAGVPDEVGVPGNFRFSYTNSDNSFK